MSNMIGYYVGVGDKIGDTLTYIKKIYIYINYELELC